MYPDPYPPIPFTNTLGVLKTPVLLYGQLGSVTSRKECKFCGGKLGSDDLQQCEVILVKLE